MLWALCQIQGGRVYSCAIKGFIRISGHLASNIMSCHVLLCRLRAALLPYTVPGPNGRRLVEVTLDEGRPAMLYFSDKSRLQLPRDLEVSVTEALAHLIAAKQAAQPQRASSSSAVGQLHDGVSELLMSRGFSGGGSQDQRDSSSSAGGGSCSPSNGLVTSGVPGSSTSAWGFLRFFGRAAANQEAEIAEAAGKEQQQQLEGLVQGLSAEHIAIAAAEVRGRAAGTPLFGSDNRMGLPNSLDRISAIRDRAGGICGLTYRVGRHIEGKAQLIGDVLGHMKRSLEHGRPQSLLLLGRPGVGKTTLLRDLARVLSLDVGEGGLGLKVVVVDTSNEIAGDGVVPHECIGRARRMMVRRREDQAGVLVEAVQNHSPEVIIVDEIGTSQVSRD